MTYFRTYTQTYVYVMDDSFNADDVGHLIISSLFLRLVESSPTHTRALSRSHDKRTRFPRRGNVQKPQSNLPLPFGDRQKKFCTDISSRSVNICGFAHQCFEKRLSCRVSGQSMFWVLEEG